VSERIDWDARIPLSSIQPVPREGRAWRLHRRRYAATDHGGSLSVSGRYHRASDQFAEGETWAALYLALSAEVALGEIIRNVSPALLAQMNDYRLSELNVELEAVLDCRDATALLLKPDDLIRDHDFAITQEIAAAAIGQGAEGILVPSATRLGDNLVVFPTQLRATSRLEVISSRDPRLFVSR
jgi:RES domain-containing protein